MRILPFLVLSLCASLALPPSALAQRQRTTLTVNYSSAEEIAAALRPLLSAGSSVSVYQDKLVLNVTPEELVNTRELLQQLDVARRQLLVSVRTDSAGSDSHRGIDVDSTIKSGNTVATTRQGGSDTEERTTVRVTNSRGSSTGSGGQAVRATEGMPAYIATGVSAPVQSYSRGPDGHTYDQQDYVQAVAGFYATTWVNDSVVRVSIDQSNDALNGDTISTQQLQSEVSGALGQWIPIGVISEAANREDSGIGSHAQSATASSTQLYLKVELLE